MYICMYEWMYRGFPSWSAHGKGLQLGLGEGPFKSGSNAPTRRYHRPRVLHADLYLHTVCAFCSQLYSGKPRVVCSLM